MFFVLMLCLICCHTPEQAEEFFEQRQEFENNWWESDQFGVCLLVDPEQEVVIFDDGNNQDFFPYEFESPNIYYIESYTARVYPNEECYDIVVKPLQETICECTY